MDTVPALKYLFVLTKGNCQIVPIFLHFCLYICYFVQLPEKTFYSVFEPSVQRKPVKYHRQRQNHRVVEVGRNLWRSSGSTPSASPAQSRVNHSRLLRAHVFHPKACTHREPVNRFTIAPPRQLKKGKVTVVSLRSLFMLFLKVFMPGKFLGVHKWRKLSVLWCRQRGVSQKLHCLQFSSDLSKTHRRTSHNISCCSMGYSRESGHELHVECLPQKWKRNRSLGSTFW